MDYRLVRSRRKTAAIHLLPDGSVEVRAPLRTPQQWIDAFVASKEDWITSHRAELLRRNAEDDSYTAGEGETLLWKGERFSIRLSAGKTVLFDGKIFSIPAGETARKAAVCRWYKEQAKALLLPRLETLSRQTGIRYSSGTVGSAATRWGSCDGKDAIRLSWRLCLLPEKLWEYVLIHELCHVLEKNHSAAFWRQVERFLPDQAELRQELRRLEREYHKEFAWLK